MTDISGGVKFADVQAGGLFGYDGRFFIKCAGVVEGPNGGEFQVVYDLAFRSFDVIPLADPLDVIGCGDSIWEQYAAFGPVELSAEDS